MEEDRNKNFFPTETIPEFFAGKNIFITGASGFMGKVLIEKLLRSCSNLNCIYILLREKRGNSVEQRLSKLFDIPLFERLKKEHPNICETKVKSITGNVKEINLGISNYDRKFLEKNISIIFHVAASVRFDDPLKDAILLNTRGTRELMKLAINMKQLQVLLHVSTTYCNTDKKVVEEHIYPAPADWQKTIELAENYDEQILKVLTKQYIYPLTNTYTFAKSLAEHVILDMASNSKMRNVPIIIFRPSIVISTLNEPMPGWIDNFNGPVGLLAACGKGILRTVCSNPDIVADFIPVDTAIKAMITAVWHQATINQQPQMSNSEQVKLSVYNCSNCGVRNATLREIIELGKVFSKDYPLDTILWIPGGQITPYKFVNFVKFICLQLLPAFFIDILLKITGHKLSLLKIQRKIYIANMALYYFISNEWLFKNNNFLNLTRNLHLADLKDWDYDFSSEDVNTYFLNAIIGAKKYLLKEDMANLDKARRNYRRMYWLDKAVITSFTTFVIYMVLFSSYARLLFQSVFGNDTNLTIMPLH